MSEAAVEGTIPVVAAESGPRDPGSGGIPTSRPAVRWRSGCGEGRSGVASHILGRMAHLLPGDWQRFYGHRVVFLETFVDPTRFAGTCYRAANWVLLGRTTGRGKDDRSHKANRSIKEILGYPLSRGFRDVLCG